MVARLLPLLLLAAAPVADAPPSLAASRAELAMRLAAWARAERDPDAMLAAARVMATSGATGGAVQGGALAAGGPSPAAALAEAAVALAPRDARVAAEAEAIREARGRGFVPGVYGRGPIYLSRRLAPRAELAWHAAAKPGERAIISVVGDGDSDIDLAVTDSAGRTICRDRARDYHPVCRWQVATSKAYRIAVSNAGRVASDVMVLSN